MKCICIDENNALPLHRKRSENRLHSLQYAKLVSHLTRLLYFCIVKTINVERLKIKEKRR